MGNPPCVLQKCSDPFAGMLCMEAGLILSLVCAGQKFDLWPAIVAVHDPGYNKW